MITMVLSLSDWPGTMLAPTGDHIPCDCITLTDPHVSGLVMAEEELMEEDKGLNRREAGMITPTWTRQGLCCGTSSTSMDLTCHGETCL